MSDGQSTSNIAAAGRTTVWLAFDTRRPGDSAAAFWVEAFDSNGTLSGAESSVGEHGPRNETEPRNPSLMDNLETRVGEELTESSGCQRPNRLAGSG